MICPIACAEALYFRKVALIQGVLWGTHPRDHPEYRA
jgi:hypothetical protein